MKVELLGVARWLAVHPALPFSDDVVLIHDGVLYGMDVHIGGLHVAAGDEIETEHHFFQFAVENKIPNLLMKALSKAQ